MSRINFDEFVEEYNDLCEKNVRFFDNQTEYFAEYKIKIVWENTLVRPDNILDYGCGIGRNIPYLINYFRNVPIFGCDISNESIKYASARYPSVQFSHCDDLKTSYKFNLILLSGVLHHVPQIKRKEVIKIVHGLLQDKGTIFIFEHNPYNPLTRVLVDRCPYDKDAILLKMDNVESLLLENGYKVINKRYTLFFPRQLEFLRLLEKHLGSIPLGGQYFVKAIKS